MATAEQIKALIRSHAGDDQERFYTLALQIAAHEAQQGHGALAVEIRELVDKAKGARHRELRADFPPELEGLVEADLPGVPAAALVLPQPLNDRLARILREYRERDKLHHHGLRHRRKILLTGPPGTGKTLTARVLAHELRLSLYTVQVDRLVTKFLGETSARLRLMFEAMREREGVYFFDEFDALGGGRKRENDVGEMRRVLTALLQFIEQDSSDSIIVAATNSPELLDRALFRRFDDVLAYENPASNERRKLVGNALGNFARRSFGWKIALEAAHDLSSADIVQACEDTLKEAVLNDRHFVTASRLMQALQERRHLHGG